MPEASSPEGSARHAGRVAGSDGGGGRRGAGRDRSGCPHGASLVRCPCGSEWVDELDIRTVVWSDLTEWVGRTLTEVHQLAQAYGWSEAEILAMSGWRRRWYLEALGW